MQLDISNERKLMNMADGKTLVWNCISFRSFTYLCDYSDNASSILNRRFEGSFSEGDRYPEHGEMYIL